jgi:hypothetical protein
LLNQEFLQALLLNFRHEGKKAIEKVARNQPAVYVRILTQLVPHELQIEHANRIKQMTDEELEATVELLHMIDAKLAGANAKLVEEVAEPAALPSPSRKPRRNLGSKVRASPLLLDAQSENE